MRASTRAESGGLRVIKRAIGFEERNEISAINASFVLPFGLCGYTVINVCNEWMDLLAIVNVFISMMEWNPVERCKLANEFRGIEENFQLDRLIRRDNKKSKSGQGIRRHE